MDTKRPNSRDELGRFKKQPPQKGTSRRCSTCDKTQPLKNFPMRYPRGKRNYTQWRCTQCEIEKRFERERNNRTICTYCGVKLTDDNWSKWSGASRCLKCYNEYKITRKYAHKDRAIEYLGGKCSNCDGVFPRVVYDFHHLDPTQKEFKVNQIVQRHWKGLKIELDKCTLLCANCHRIEHSALQENSLWKRSSSLQSFTSLANGWAGNDRTN